MAEPKTRPTRVSVDDFIDTLADEQLRDDCRALARIMSQITKADACMWGPSIVGFGSQALKYATGKELDWPLAAFSPRKQNLTIYIMPGFDQYDDLMAKLGRHSCGKVCLYLKRLSDVHLPTLKTLIRESVKHAKKKAG